ncbi:MAG: ABC transporter ATP-binding protein [Nitrospirota bacterium]|nr:MAG: ABC transporter ATP-binding protein [Nitrospirota bacterium]
MTGKGISLSGVSKVYEGDIPVTGVVDIDLSIPERAVWVLAGPSGSGKTTLLNLIGGMDRPTAGEIVVGGKELHRLSEEGLSMYRRSNVGFVFQGNNLIPTLNVSENVRMPLLLNNDIEADNKVKEILSRIGLGSRSNAMPDQLSGGEQQRVAIARALVHSPDIVLADEPTGNLDSGTAQEIYELINEMNAVMNTIILFATHDRMIIDRSQNVLNIKDGRLV